MLEGRKVTKSFGGLLAVKNVDFQVRQGEIVGLVGPNGAGKSTLLNLISRFHRLDSGKIVFEGEDITKLQPHQVCRRGIARTSQIVQSFPEMTALENVATGVFFGKDGKMSMKDALDKAREVLGFVGFSNAEIDVPARNLNIVELRRLQLAKALATSPKLLLLDEVTTGLNPVESQEAVELIKKIRESGITIFMVEHVMRVIMGLCERIMVLHHGEKIAEGTPKEVASNQTVINSYLGEKYIF